MRYPCKFFIGIRRITTTTMQRQQQWAQKFSNLNIESVDFNEYLIKFEGWNFYTVYEEQFDVRQVDNRFD